MEVSIITGTLVDVVVSFPFFLSKLLFAQMVYEQQGKRGIHDRELSRGV